MTTGTQATQALLGPTSEYLYGSAIERLIHWCHLRNNRPSGTETRFQSNEAKDGCLVVNETAQSTASRSPSNQLDEDSQELTKLGRHNEAHSWSLPKRVFVAGVICLYTYVSTPRNLDTKLTPRSFVVYAASAIYIIGIPEMIMEFELSEQEALLGLSLYVLACQYRPSFAGPFDSANSASQMAWDQCCGHL